MGKFHSIEDRSEELLSLVEEFFPEPVTDLDTSDASSDVVLEVAPGDRYETDEALVRAIGSSQQGQKFNKLFLDGDQSDFGNNHSSADAALVSILVFWLGEDIARIDQVFRKSALMRPKWDQKRGKSTYGRLTIEKAHAFLNRERLNDEPKKDVRKDKGTSPQSIDSVKRFSLIPFSEIEVRKNGDYLVKDLLLQGGLSMVYGPSNSGKTFVAIDLAIHIATGLPWNGLPIVQSDVVYIAAEGGQGIAKRIVAVRDTLNLNGSDISFYLLPDSVDLSGGSEDITALIESIDEYRSDSRPLLVIVDTLSRALSGTDENSGADISAMLSQVDRLQRELGAAVLLVHHTGKDVSRGERGHSSLRAAVDTSIQVKVDKEKNRKFDVTKQRDLDGNFTLPFYLEPVTIRIEGTCEVIQSCVVKASKLIEADSTERIQDPRYESLTKSARLALSVIQDYRRERPESNALEPIPHAELVRLLETAGISLSKKTNSVKRAITRSLDQLVKEGYISRTPDGVREEPDI